MAEHSSPTPGDLDDALAARPYPGRGLVVAQLGERLAIVYFLTGRSEASRRRKLLRDPDGAISVVATAGVGADPLRHYRAAQRSPDLTVVGNGDHVEDVYRGLRSGLAVSDVLASQAAEPDPPIWTPRIWVACRPRLPIQLALARNRSDHDGVRTLWSISGLQPGEAVLLTTYQGDPDKVEPSTSPVETTTAAADHEQLLQGIWDALAPDLRVAAVVIDPADPETYVAVRT